MNPFSVFWICAMIVFVMMIHSCTGESRVSPYAISAAAENCTKANKEIAVRITSNETTIGCK